MPESSERGALTEAVFFILLTLHEPAHGYGIMKHIKDISNGRVVLGSGTLYGALNTLIDKGWIKISNQKSEDQKKEYIITEEGRKNFQNELERLRELIQHAVDLKRRS